MSGDALFRIGHSSIHKTGLFAACNIEAETEIVQYLGERISKEESTRRALEWEAPGAVNQRRHGVYI